MSDNCSDIRSCECAVARARVLFECAGEKLNATSYERFLLKSNGVVALFQRLSLVIHGLTVANAYLGKTVI